MPKNTQTININFDASMDIAQVKAAVSAIEKSFSGIKLPQGLFNRLTTDLQKLQDELTNFSSLSSNMKNLSDIGKSEKSLEKIISLYRRLQLEISEIDGLDPKKLLPDSVVQKIGKVEKAFSSYQSSITEIGKEADATKKKIEKLLKLKTEHRQLASTRSTAESRKREVEAELPGAQARATIAKETTAAAKKSGVDINSQQYLELVEAQKQAENEARALNDELKRLQSTISNSTTSLQKNEEAQKQFSDITETFGTKIKDLKQALDTVGQTQAAAALQKLKEQLSQIDGFDVSNLKDDLSNLDDLTRGLSAEALEKIENGLEEIKKNSNEAERGIESMDNALGETAKSGEELTRTANEVERLKEQVFDFFSIGNSIELFKKSVRSAFDTVKELDKAMTETAVVTDFTVGDMWSQLPQYSEMANRLGTSILGAYEATTLYYQQGLKTNEVMAVSNETLKMARIASMDAADATDLMTAALRGFNMEINEGSAQRVNDVYSELAAVTAADTQEIGVAMSKTASIAASANMEFETTAALLSQIIETTREAPETAGTAMKTIIARFTEVKTLFGEGQLIGADTEGEEININKIDEALKTVGISLKDFLNGTKGIDDIFLELASKWDTLDIATQRYIATTAAGSRQQSRFLAMMSNYDRTMELVDAAYNSTGASQEQFNKTLDSMESKLAQLKNAWDQFTMGLANNEILKFGVELLTSILTTVNKLIEALSGGNGLTKSFLSLAAAIISLRTGKGILHKIFGGESGGLLEGLLGKKSDIKGQSEKAGRESAFAFVSSFKKGGKREGKNLFSEIFTTEQTGKALEKTQKHFSDLFSRDLDKANLTEEQKVKIITEYDSGNFDAAIAQAKEYGVVIESDTEKAKVFAQSSTINMNAVAVSAGLVGLAFSGIGSALEEAGNTDAALVFQNIGNALMGISAILPLLSAGAKALGVSFTAAGVQIGAAGQVAQLGWGWISLILGGVAALIGGIIALNKAAHEASLEGRMEAATERTKAAEEAANSAKEAYDNLLGEQDKYSELQSALDGLVKGTDEWKRALVEANQQVLTLLSTYPELAKYIQKGDSGQLTIVEEGFEEVINNQLEGVKNTQAAVATAQLNEQVLQQEKINQDLQKNFKAKTGYSRDDSGRVYATGEGVAVSRESSYDSGFAYEKDIMDEMLSQFRANPDELFKRDENGEYSEALKAIAEQSDYTAEELYNMKDALAEYDAAMLASEEQSRGLAESLLTAQASEETANYKYGENVISGFAKQMTAEDYTARVQERAGDIYSKDGSSESENNEKFKALAEQEGVISKMTGDDLKDLQTLYAAMADIDISQIPENIKEDKEALAKEIAAMDMSKEISENMEKFRSGMSKMAEEDQRSLAGLLSGDASQFTKAELDQLGNLSDYASKMEMTPEEMAKNLGYNEKTLSAMEKEDQEVYAKLQLGEGATEEAIADYIAKHGTEKIPVGVQLDIDSSQLKAQMQEQFDKASADLQAKGINENLYKNLSVGTVSALSKQTSQMGTEEAKIYVENFNKVLSSSNLGKTEQEELETYLANVDWSSMDEAIAAMDYMQDVGLDDETVKAYWEAAIEGANTYVTSLAQAVQLMDKLHGASANVDEMLNRLTEGTATSADIEALSKAGVDLEGALTRTADGWKMSEEAAKEATDSLRKDIIEQANSALETQETRIKEFNQLRNASTGVGLGAGLTTLDEEGKLRAGDFANAGQEVKTAVAGQLGVERGAYNSDAEYWATAEKAYTNYINTVNNQNAILETMRQETNYLRATTMTSSQNEALGGPDQSVIWSAQNEAQQADIDVNEMMAYADSLQSVHKGLSDVTAAQVALGNSKMNMGLGEIIGSYEEWTDLIDKNSGLIKATTSEDVAAYNKLKSSVNKMLNTSEDLSDAFWDNADNMENIKKAAEGDTKALGKLQKAAAKDYLVNLAVDPDFEGSAEEINKLADFIMGYELPSLEAGATLDDSDFINACNSMIIASGMTAEQIANAFKGLGYDVEVDYVTAKTKVPQYTTETSAPIPTAGGGFTQTSSTRLTGFEEMDGLVPVVKSLTSTGSGGGGVSVGNQKAGKANKSKGGGGGKGGGSKKEKEEEPWENPYDWLYNLTQDINNELRKREKLELKYNRILRDRSKNAKDLYDNIKAQTASLKEQERLQQQMLSKRQQEMRDYLSKNSSLSSYGTFNWADNTIEINWDKINSVTDQEKGEEIEEYISKLEEIQGQMNDAEDALDEIIDEIYELQQIGKDEFDDLESRTLDALIQRDQEAIDKLSNINDSINNANQKLLDSVQKNLDKIRQDRQNEETEQNLAEKERQLAYLRQDTSGANAMQIRQLEEELANEQESYTDTLIDQKISELQQQNDEAAEQRERQIELAQAQLDYAQENGLYWQEAHKIMQEGVNAAGALIKGSELVSILGSAEGWDAMSEIQQMNWLSQLEETSKQALQYFAQQRQLENIGKKSGSITFTNANGQTLTGTVQSDGSVKVSTGSGTYTYKDVYQNYDGTYRTLEGQSDASYVANKPATPPPSSNTGSSSGSYYRATPYRGYSIVDGLKAIGEYTASEYKNRKKIAAANGIKNYTGSASQNTQMLRLLQQGKLKKYAKGGLVDTTGLAWLDGTASSPEMILQAKDTENFIQLKNILAEVLKGKENAISERSGDNYFEIYIEVDSLGNDYDVEQLAGKIKRMINEDARYRNVNAINILR
jgi:TP901 family phage tail tape measure protein